MLKRDLILRSPVAKTIGIEQITQGRFGAVVSRAGVGKTSFLVQIALTQLLKNEKILHVSLTETIEKINIRYHEGYTSLVDSIGYVDSEKALRVWEDISPNKVAISYNDATFDTQKIKDYLESFKHTDLSLPSIMIIDGIDFDKDQTELIREMEVICSDFPIFIWFAMQSHREEDLCDDGFPIQLEAHKDKFDKAIFLQPVENKIEAIVLMDGDRTDTRYTLNPATMMAVQEE